MGWLSATNTKNLRRVQIISGRN